MGNRRVVNVSERVFTLDGFQRLLDSLPEDITQFSCESVQVPKGWVFPKRTKLELLNMSCMDTSFDDCSLLSIAETLSPAIQLVHLHGNCYELETQRAFLRMIGYPSRLVYMTTTHSEGVGEYIDALQTKEAEIFTILCIAHKRGTLRLPIELIRSTYTFLKNAADVP